MILDPNMIRRDMTPDEVLRAMLPVVREAFAGPVVKCSRDTLCRSFKGNTPRTYSRPEVTWATIFASHVLPALMDYAGSPLGTGSRPLEEALAAFRDAWCAAATNASRETK